MPYVNPITQPYGDITTSRPVNLDHTLNMIYQQGQQRAAQRKAEQDRIDNEMSNEFGKIRSVDIPDFTDAYADFKDKRKRVLFDKQLRRDPKAYQQAKRDADLAQAKLYQIGNKSKETLAYEKANDDFAKANPYDLNEEYDKNRNLLRNTPVTKIDAVELGKDEKGNVLRGSLLDDSRYRDNTPAYDFAKVTVDAAGKTPRLTGYQENKKLDDFNDQLIEYGYGNSPEQFRNIFGASFSDEKTKGRAVKTATKLGNQIPDDEYVKMVERYNQIPDEELKRRGEKGRFEMAAPTTPAEKYLNYATMQYALANDAKPLKTSKTPNIAAKNAADLKKQQQLIRDRAAAQKDVAQFKSDLDGKEAVDGIDKYFKYILQDSQARPVDVGNLKGDKTATFDIPITDDILNAVTVKGEPKPDAIRYVPNKGIQRIYYARTFADDKDKVGKVERNPNGSPYIDETASTIIPIDQAKINMGKHFYGGKYLSAVTQSTGTKVEPTPAKKTISRSDLSSKAKAAGYSTAEYTELLKKNGITIKD